MKKLAPLFVVAASFLVIAPSSKAVVTIGHTQGASAGPGSFLTSGGTPVLAGGVSIGFFATPVTTADDPLDAAFGSTIVDWDSMLAAGWTDVRTLPGAMPGPMFDWDFPPPVGGSELSISFGALPAATQLYIEAFNVGVTGLLPPDASTFDFATEWAVVKDPTYLSPVDLGTKAIILSVASGAEIIKGMDGPGSDILMVAIPEPSRAVLAILGFAVCGLRRRR